MDLTRPGMRASLESFHEILSPLGKTGSRRLTVFSELSGSFSEGMDVADVDGR
jgi:hypothetical protein